MTKKKTDYEDDEIAQLLKTVADHFHNEDRVTRERQIRHWRRLKLYWNNFSQIYWSEVAHDYKVFGQEVNTYGYDTDQSYYDRPVNVFKAFLETIIAALSIQIPAISCVPDDADNPLDVSTAKGGDKISELIYKHNDVIFLWLYMLYIYCTEGMIAVEMHVKEDKDFGTYEEDKTEEFEEDAQVCNHCGARLPDEIFSEEQINKFDPNDDDAPLHAAIYEKGPVCNECGEILDPELTATKLTVERIVGKTTKIKSRICLNAYGGLWVKVANYAKDQKGTPYLIKSEEKHYTWALEKWPHLREALPQPAAWTNVGVNDPYEQYGRLNPQYRGEFPLEVITIKHCWLRPESFNILEDEDCKKLKRKFPDGAMLAMANECVAEYKNECLDDKWTLSQNPMSDYLVHDPLGELLTNIQDIVNDLISLTLQTIEHGITQTWVDPAVVDFNGQRQIETMPGTLSPTKTVSGNKTIGDAFYTSKLAALAPEVLGFYKIVQELAQFVSGALPSLFGGQQVAGSSRTASEYAMQKGMALQRQQTPWKMMTILWKKVFGKAIPAYIELMVKDEKVVEKTSQGGFINTFIKRAELDGKIGSIELEPDEKLPITDEQQADIIMQLFQLNNQEITAGLMDPDNLPYIKKVIKIPEFVLPGEADREKQYDEITQLLNEQPINLPPDPKTTMMHQAAGQQPQPVQQTSVPIDPEVDNHQVEASICRSWLISGAGRLAKIENPNGYMNVMLHMKAHMMAVQPPAPPQAEAPKVNFSVKADLSDPDARTLFEKTMNLPPTPPPTPPVKANGSGNGSGNGAKPPKQPEKITGESNGRFPIQ